MHEGMPLLEYAESARPTGAILRDEGMALAKANASEWFGLAIIELENIWKTYRHETNEWLFEIHKFPICRALGEHWNWSKCAGSLAKEARKRGWIEYAGTGQAQNSTGHASLRRTYRWL